MSKRLQVVFEDDELAEIKLAAQRRRQTVAEWVRGALREARSADAGRPVAEKLRAVREATTHYAFPTGSIEQISAEIARGYARREE